MSAIRPIAKIDLRGIRDDYTYVEVLTSAGVVRVNVGLVDTQTAVPVITVESQFQNPEHWHIEDGFAPRLTVRYLQRVESLDVC